MFILLNTDSLIIKQKIDVSKIIILTVVIVFLIIQFRSFNQIEIDHYNMNYEDKINSLKIGEKIKEYEDITGNKITKIAIYKDKFESYTYKDIIAIKDINITAFYPDWSIIDMINYYNNLKLEETEKNKEIEQEFLEKDWNDFNYEQIIFIEDTLHYCKF